MDLQIAIMKRILRKLVNLNIGEVDILKLKIFKNRFQHILEEQNSIKEQSKN